MINKVDRSRMPKWIDSDKSMDLVLSNDIDSLISCAVLTSVHPKWNIHYYYDFKGLYRMNNSYFANDKVWVDVAIQNGDKAFDNHVSLATEKTVVNRQMVNPNLMLGKVTSESYYHKYCGSTLLLIWALYGLPIPESEEGKMILMAIDTSYKGLLSGADKFLEDNYYYINCLFDMPELTDCVFRHTEEDFREIIKKYNLNQDFRLVDGYLHSDINLSKIGELLGINISLPSNKFDCIERFSVLPSTNNRIDDKARNNIINYSKWGIISASFTGKNNINYSRRICK